MKPASDPPTARPEADVPLDPSLASLLARLERVAQEPGFQLQRAAALGQALRPYAEYARMLPIAPLAEELALANLYVYADYFPTDGQLSLVEQVRDMIEVHVPQEERAWLDPLRHSYMDLLEIVSTAGEGRRGTLALRSLGERKEFIVEAGPFGATVEAGQVLLTRLIRLPDRSVLPGVALVLSAMVARSIFGGADEWRRAMEAQSGTFALGDWQEFAKGYGHILLWQVAQARLGTLILADERLQYRTVQGKPLLYAVALYDHHDYRFLAQQLAEQPDLQPDERENGTDSRTVWTQHESDDQGRAVMVARLTLTPTQLVVEADAKARLDSLKHVLASTCGFSLHFRGESTQPPNHELPAMDLLMDTPPSRSLVVPLEEEQRLLSTFLESIYLEWAERPAPALGGQTPRHAATHPQQREQVAALIEQLEREDLARRRTGKPGYDYNRLRAHLGLPEVHV
ncbi:MAG: hypothetical protein EPO61_01565 [Nitrospirae bacterium]|nr:MAG: hypothetical protein EPO61_01565 [Nitrospirota bacterium]